MTPKFSVKNDIKAQHYVTVKLTKLGEPTPDNYGANKYESECLVDGVQKHWTLSENMYKKVTQHFKEGDTFCVQRWHKSPTSNGYNYLPEGDINIINSTPMKRAENQMGLPSDAYGITPPTQPTPPPPTQKHESQPPKKDDAYWDDVNRGKVRHGVACSMIEANINIHEIPKEAIDKWVDYIMTGK